MDSGKRMELLGVKWHFLVMIVFILSVLLGAIGAVIGLSRGDIGPTSVLLGILCAAGVLAGLLIAVFAILLLIFENVRGIKINTAKQEDMLTILEKNRVILENNAVLGYDWLIIATGAKLVYTETEGLKGSEC